MKVRRIPPEQVLLPLVEEALIADSRDDKSAQVDEERSYTDSIARE